MLWWQLMEMPFEYVWPKFHTNSLSLTSTVPSKFKRCLNRRLSRNVEGHLSILLLLKSSTQSTVFWVIKVRASNESWLLFFKFQVPCEQWTACDDIHTPYKFQGFFLLTTVVSIIESFRLPAHTQPTLISLTISLKTH